MLDGRYALHTRPPPDYAFGKAYVRHCFACGGWDDILAGAVMRLKIPVRRSVYAGWRDRAAGASMTMLWI